jgi:hypothetical protein
VEVLSGHGSAVGPDSVVTQVEDDCGAVLVDVPILSNTGDDDATLVADQTFGQVLDNVLRTVVVTLMGV